MTDWKPTKTAPKDGRSFIVYFGDERVPVKWRTRIAFYDRDNCLFRCPLYPGDDEDMYIVPDFWCELPPIPSRSKKGEDSDDTD